MKLRRIFAAIAACAVAATMAVSAYAADPLAKIVTKSDGSAVKMDNQPYPWVQGNYDIAKVDKIELIVTTDKIGKIQYQIGYNNAAAEWTASKGTIEADDIKPEMTITVDKIGGLGESKDGVFMFGFDWVEPTGCVWEDSKCTASDEGVLTVTGYKLYDKDGKEVGAPAETPKDPSSSETPKDPSSSETPKDEGNKNDADDSNKPTGATAGLALAGLAIAGAAVVAAKKSK